MILLLLNCTVPQNKTPQGTRVSIVNKSWYYNNEIINRGSAAEGLLMNVRMVNSVYEDQGSGLENFTTQFNPEANMQTFIEKIPEYVSNGVNAFTISIQGGFPGYEGAVNTAFQSDGSLRDSYMERIEKVITACNVNHSAVILTLFYQRQHSHELALSGKGSIQNALVNVVNWVTEKKFENVLIEISNEYRHGGYQNWVDGEWLMSEAGQVELLRLAKQINPKLLVSTSGMGNGFYPEELAHEADFLLIHFNNTSLQDYGEKIKTLSKYEKPIVCNEDDKTGREGAIALMLSVLNGSGWGYMNADVNQSFPFTFSGIADDSIVYKAFKKVSAPGYQINQDSLKQTAITITSPNDGDIFSQGHSVNIKLSHLYPDISTNYTIELQANNTTIALLKEKLQVVWVPNEPGIYVLEAIVLNEQGVELYRSPKVDIIVE